MGVWGVDTVPRRIGPPSPLGDPTTGEQDIRGYGSSSDAHGTERDGIDPLGFQDMSGVA